MIRWPRIVTWGKILAVLSLIVIVQAGENTGNCDFENGNCGYQDVSEDSYIKWNVTLASDALQKSQHAPVDHTTGTRSGHYAWTERIPGSRGGILTNIRSPDMKSGSRACHVTFWAYRQPGKVFSGWTPPDLRVTIATTHDTRSFNIYNTAYGAKPIPNNIWTEVSVYVGHIYPPYTINFETEVLSKEGFVAVDDISVIQCEPQMTALPCSGSQFTCASKNGCIAKNLVCDFTPDCDDDSDEIDCKMADLNCDFESSFCKWKDYAKVWKRTKGTIAGPGRDHTLGTPQGISLKAPYDFDSDKPKTHKLGGLVFYPTQNCTMRFYSYLMNVSGYNSTQLKVSTRQHASGEEKVYFSRDQHIADRYFRDEVTFKEEKSFEVVFEAYVGYFFDVLALDDISFDGGCRLDPNV